MCLLATSAIHQAGLTSIMFLIHKHYCIIYVLISNKYSWSDGMSTSVSTFVPDPYPGAAFDHLWPHRTLDSRYVAQNMDAYMRPSALDDRLFLGWKKRQRSAQSYEMEDC